MPGSSGRTTAGARRTSTTTQGAVRPGRLRSEDMGHLRESCRRDLYPARAFRTPPWGWGRLGWGAPVRADSREGTFMGEIHVHEFMSLDGVVDAPVWTAE